MLVEQKIKEVLVDSVGLEITEDNQNLFAAGLDSIGTVDLIFALEAAFEISFTESDLNVAQFESVNKIKCLIEEKQ